MIRLAIILVSVVLLSSCKQPRKLPYLQMETTDRVVNGKTITDTIFRKIPDFKLYNQDSAVVTQKDFENKIYVADFFFTSCPTICPVMHRNLLKVYNKYKGNDKFKIASHTIDVKYDTPSRLKSYAHKLGVEGSQWEYLWGTRDEIYALAERNYIVAAQEDNRAPGGFVHQGYLILVDKEKRIRGAYDGTLDSDVAQLIEDIEVLLLETK